MKLGDIDLIRGSKGWFASVSIASENDPHGFTFTVGPEESVTSLLNEAAIVIEGLIGFSNPTKERIPELSKQLLTRGSIGYDSGKSVLTRLEEEL